MKKKNYDTNKHESPARHLLGYNLIYKFMNKYSTKRLHLISIVIFIISLIFCGWSINSSLLNQSSTADILIKKEIISESEFNRIKLYANKNHIDYEPILQRIILDGQFTIVNELSRRCVIVEENYTSEHLLYFCVYENHQYYITSPVYGKGNTILTHKDIINHFHIYTQFGNINANIFIPEHLNDSFLTTLSRKLNLYF